jgi:hypothetical protein
MIVRTQPDGRLLCIHQTSHALMAYAFCRAWGNRDFAAPTPLAPVLAGIAQHDNGWTEWEAAPRLRPDGVPMDFMHGLAVAEKLALWQRGIDRAAAQHPYAGLLVSRHAALLYQQDLPRLQGADYTAVRSFVEQQEMYLAQVRYAWAGDPILGPALAHETVLAHTRLLQFGDNASLQVCVPWDARRTFAHCPVDFRGSYCAIEMAWDESTITFAPWPFGVTEFSVSIHGKLLDRPTFPDDQAYQAALAAAPYLHLTWRVIPG